MKKPLFPLLLLALLALGLTHRPAPTLRPNKDYALFFAVNDYQDNSGFNDLTKPIENAEAIAKILRERYAFETEVVKNPTLDQIDAKLQEYKARFAKNPQGRYPSNGQLLIYFTGHGVAENNNGYFVPANGQATKLYSTALAYAIWRPIIDGIDCRHIIVAIDACYSVTFDPDWYDKKMNLTHFKRPGELSEGDKLLLANETDKCRILFCSDGSEDKVPERSNFARKFIEALEAGPRQDGILPSEGLAGYLRFAAPKPHLAAFGSDEKGSFLFVQKTDFTTARNPPETSPGQATPDPTALADLEKDLRAWQAAKAANTIAAYQDYRDRFPRGEFREQARLAIEAIENDLALRRDDLAWQIALEKNTRPAYEKYQTDFPAGRHYAEATAKIKALDNTVTLPDDGLVPVKGGTFTMGCTSEQQDCGSDEKPTHQVTVGDFYLGKYEVTNSEYCKFLNERGNQSEGGAEWINLEGSYGNEKCRIKKSGSRFVVESGYENHPVIYVSWYGAKAYCDWMGKGYRLPTEAEWEYAARGGGKQVLFGNGKNVADPAEINFDASSNWKTSYSVAGTYRQKTIPVGSLNSPNALGLHDMSGNVWEWCSDWYGSDYYKNSPSSNPAGPSSGSSRVLRGGSWDNYPQGCRVANRVNVAPGVRVSGIGFRLARTN